ncbi:HTH domain-containing protein, partial [Catenibacterium mitsuokai]
MGANYFSDEQVKELGKNPYVKKVSVKSITYSEEFKELFWTDLQKGMLPRNI